MSHVTIAATFPKVVVNTTTRRVEVHSGLRDAVAREGLAAEEAARIAADDALQAAIEAEEAARIAADQALADDIAAEAAAREALDDALAPVAKSGVAADVAFTPAGGISTSDVQAAIEEAAAKSDMVASTYDPQGIVADTFDRSNHTGTQALATISDALVQLTYSRASKAALEATTVPGDVDEVRLRGYTTVGDGGGALYVRVGSEPDHPGKIQSADDAWWEIAEHVMNVRAFGAVGGDPVFDKPAMEAAIAAAQALNKAVYFPEGTYITDWLRIENMSNDVEWFGNGPAKSIIKRQAGSLAKGGSTNLLFFRNPSHDDVTIHLRDLALDGNAEENPFFLEVDDVTGFVVGEEVHGPDGTALIQDIESPYLRVKLLTGEFAENDEVVGQTSSTVAEAQESLNRFQTSQAHNFRLGGLSDNFKEVRLERVHSTDACADNFTIPGYAAKTTLLSVSTSGRTERTRLDILFNGKMGRVIMDDVHVHHFSTETAGTNIFEVQEFTGIHVTNSRIDRWNTSAQFMKDDEPVLMPVSIATSVINSISGVSSSCVHLDGCIMNITRRLRFVKGSTRMGRLHITNSVLNIDARVLDEEESVIHSTGAGNGPSVLFNNNDIYVVGDMPAEPETKVLFSLVRHDEYLTLINNRWHTRGIRPIEFEMQVGNTLDVPGPVLFDNNDFYFEPVEAATDMQRVCVWSRRAYIALDIEENPYTRVILTNNRVHAKDAFLFAPHSLGALDFPLPYYMSGNIHTAGGWLIAYIGGSITLANRSAPPHGTGIGLVWLHLDEYQGTELPASGYILRGQRFRLLGAAAGEGAVFVSDSSVTDGSITWRMVEQAGVKTGIGDAPSYVGQVAVVSGQAYIATGTSSPADWQQITPVS